jgi:hypothetical protein
VDTAQSDFTLNRPRPGISLWVLAVWTYLLTGKNQYRFQVHRLGKNLALDGAFQVDDVQIFGK